MVNEEQQPKTETEILQSKVDKLKALSLLNNVHNLSPSQNKQEFEGNQIEIVKALSSEPRLLEIFLEAQGKIFDPSAKQTIDISEPIMNVKGAWKLVTVCKKIAQEAEWSNFESEKVPDYIVHFYESNYPYFTLWHEEYALDPRDFNYISTTLQMFILASFYKGKSGKFLNVISKTYSEDLLGKMASNTPEEKHKSILDTILNRRSK